MTNLHSVHFLVPFALPTQQHLPILDSSNLTGLKEICRKAQIQHAHKNHTSLYTLPHECWLMQHFGIKDSLHQDHYPTAPYLRLADGLKIDQHRWSCLEPVHIHITIDHLTLIGAAALKIEEAEMQALIDAAKPILDAFNIEYHFQFPQQLYIQHPILNQLSTASPLRTNGQNLKIWLSAPAQFSKSHQLWMQLQNEIQMAWFNHPVNLKRQQKGLPEINSVWMHGAGSFQPTHTISTDVFSQQLTTKGLTLASSAQYHALPENFKTLYSALNPASHQQHHLLIELHSLQIAAIQNQLAQWLEILEHFDQNWFLPAIQALKTKQICQLQITLSSETTLYTLNLKRHHLKYFWRNRSLKNLVDIL